MFSVVKFTLMQKFEFFLRRLGTSLFVLIGVSVITFFLARVVPSNAAALYIGPKAVSYTHL